MNIRKGLAALLVALVASGAVAWADVSIVKKPSVGWPYFRPSAVIVVADDVTPVALYAAEELRDHIAKATGERVPISREKNLNAGGRTLILVGDSKLAAGMGYETAKIDPEKLVVLIKGDRVLLIGGDRGTFDLSIGEIRNANGTLYAVYDFLEKEVGVRWLWPGDTGTFIPKRDTISVAETERTFTPPLVFRNIRFGLSEYSEIKPWMESMTKLGRTPRMSRELWNEYGKWVRRRRLGRRASFAWGHAYDGWLERYGKEHPEWFAMMPDGKRVTPENPYPDLRRAKFCITNPELLDFIAKKGLQFWAEHPDVMSFSACPNDSRGYCMCPKCRALDPPEGIKDPVNYPSGTKMYPSLSDRYVWYWNELAKRVGDEFPGKYISAYAYSNYRFPPLREKLSPRVLISYVGFMYLDQAFTEQSRKDWAGWGATGGKMFLRPNHLLAGHGYPLNYSRELGRDLKECYRTGMIGADFDTMTHHYGAQAPIYYVLSVLLWDPDRDVDDILNEFYTAAYGPAAEIMKKYWDRLEEVTTVVRTTDVPGQRAHDHYAAKFEKVLVPKVYTDALFKELRGLIAESRLAAADRPDVLARLGTAEVGLEYGEIQRNMLVNVARYHETGKNLKETLELREKKLEFFRKHIGDRTIGLGHVYWREGRNEEKDTMYGNLLSAASAQPKTVAEKRKGPQHEAEFSKIPINVKEPLTFRPDIRNPFEVILSSGKAHLLYYRQKWQAMRLVTPAGSDVEVTDLFFYAIDADGFQGGYWSDPQGWDERFTFKDIAHKEGDTGRTLLIEGRVAATGDGGGTLNKQVYASVYPGESRVFVVTRLTADKSIANVRDYQYSYLRTNERLSNTYVSAIKIDGQAEDMVNMAAGDSTWARQYIFAYLPNCPASIAVLSADAANSLYYRVTPNAKAREIRVISIDGRPLKAGETIERRYIIYWNDGHTLDEVEKMSGKLQAGELDDRFYTPAE